MPAQRRTLKFAALDEIVAEAERLRAGGCDAVGKWNLFQACDHLERWMAFPLDGFPRAPFPMNAVLWAMRHTIAKSLLRKVRSGAALPAGGPTDPRTVAPPEGDADAAVRKLAATAARLQASAGPFHASPLFGALGKDDLVRLNCAHAALHLSFLVPKA